MEHVTNEELSKKLDDHILKYNLDAEKIRNMWWKIGLSILIPTIGMIYGYGQLNANQVNQQHTIDQLVSDKANKETVESQFAAVNQSLGRIEGALKINK